MVAREPGRLTRRLGEVLAFIHDWADECGLDMRNLPSDYQVAKILVGQYDVEVQTAVNYMVQLRAAGCFGNPTDIRLALVNGLRIKVLRDCLKFVDRVNGSLEVEAMTLKTEILSVL